MATKKKTAAKKKAPAAKKAVAKKKAPSKGKATKEQVGAKRPGTKPVPLEVHSFVQTGYKKKRKPIPAEPH